ncbi:uncharacterized protein LOC134209445 [Armigeres subalbatus]|uniref:uncharacterized protein LOC134209445 n=1 Tax=Armigeres subalbatus TaxID=124917 RepID=UPI002ED67EB4
MWTKGYEQKMQTLFSDDETYTRIRQDVTNKYQIKLLVTSIKSAVKAAEHEQIALKKKAEAAEKVLKDAAEHTAVETQHAPKSPRTTRTEKRGRDSPGEQEGTKKQRNVQDFASVLKERVKDGEWQTVENQREKRKQQKENVEKRKEQKKQEKRRSPRERVKGDALIVEASDKTSYAAILKKRKQQKENVEKRKEQKKQEKRRSPRERVKGDALIVEASDKTSYAAILKKVREDPELKDLGEKVVRTRRTQKGELLFELKKDPTIKSSAFRELIANSLGSDGNVRALTQEAVVECRDLDEITTEDELRDALVSQCKLGKCK